MSIFSTCRKTLTCIKQGCCLVTQWNQSSVLWQRVTCTHTQTNRCLPTLRRKTGLLTLWFRHWVDKSVFPLKLQLCLYSERTGSAYHFLISLTVKSIHLLPPWFYTIRKCFYCKRREWKTGCQRWQIQVLTCAVSMRWRWHPWIQTVRILVCCRFTGKDALWDNLLPPTDVTVVAYGACEHGPGGEEAKGLLDDAFKVT